MVKAPDEDVADSHAIVLRQRARLQRRKDLIAGELDRAERDRVQLTPLGRLGTAVLKLGAVGVLGVALGSLISVFVPETFVSHIALQSWLAILTIATTILGFPRWLASNFVLRYELNNADLLFFDGLIDDEERERMRGEAMNRHRRGRGMANQRRLEGRNAQDVEENEQDERRR